MTTAIAPAAPASTTSGVNSPPNKSEWTKEIHTPDSTFNAHVPVDLIVRNPDNRMPTDESIESLARTIEAEGLLQPIALRQLASGHYMIIAGETRWLACRSLRRSTIAAHIRKGAADEAGDTAKRLIENLSRTDLPAIDKARGFKQLSEAGRTQKQIGELFGLSQPVVANTIRMLSLPEDVMEWINSGELTEAHGVVLVRWARWPKVCAIIAEACRRGRYSAKDLARHELPEAYELHRKGLIVEIKTRGQSWEKDPIYTLPLELEKDPDFITSDWCAYCLAPAKWLPEKKRQDEAREAKAEKDKGKAAKAVASGKKTPEQLAMAKKIKDNRQLRADIVRSYEASIDALKAAKDITLDMLTVLIEEAMKHNANGNGLEDAEDDIDIHAPAAKALTGEDKWKDEFDYLEVSAGGSLGAVKLACAAIALRKREESLRFLSGVPAHLRLLGQTAPALTAQQQLQRAADKVEISPAKLVLIAADIESDIYKTSEIAKRHQVKPDQVKAVGVALEVSEALRTICAQAHAAAESVANKDPQRAALAAKAKPVKAAKKGGAK